MSPRRRLTSLAPLLAVLTLALLWRAIGYYELSDTPLAAWHTWDQSDMHSFWQQATALAGGDWLARQPYYPYHAWMKGIAPEVWARWHPPGMFYQPPLYSYFLAALMRVAPDPAQAARLAQLGLGVATCALLYGLTRRLFGRAAGLLAGLIAAFYGPLIMLESQLLRETLIVFWATLACWLYAVWSRHSALAVAAGRPNRARFGACVLGLGALLGAMTMLHEAGLLLALALGVAGARRAWQGGGRPRALAWAGLFSLGVLVGFSPLLVRNLLVGAPPLPQYAGSAVAFAVVNQADSPAGGRLWQGPPPTLARTLAHAQGSTPGLIREVWRTYEGNPLPWLGHWLRRVLTLAEGGESNENLCYDYFRLTVPILNLCLDFRALLPLALAGMVLWRARRWRASLRQGTPPVALLLFGVLTVLLISAALPLGRYRLVLLPCLIPFAARLGVGLWANLHARRWRSLSRALALLALFILTQWSLGRLQPVGGLRATDFIVASRILSQWDRPDLAEQQLAFCLNLGAKNRMVQGELLLARGQACEKRGEYLQAAAQYEQALTRNSSHLLALARLAWIKATCVDGRLRNGQQALALAQRYGTEAPPANQARALDLLAAAQAELGDFAQAARLAGEALQAARQQGQQTLAREIAARLTLYRQAQPYRQP